MALEFTCNIDCAIDVLNKSHIISTDEDPGLRIESFAVINLRGVSTNKTILHLQLPM
jgi:hypothetical protein